VSKEADVANLIFSAITSLDGFIADTDGRFDWSEPDAEVHSFLNELVRPIGTHLCGRRTYEVMAAWDGPELASGQPAHIEEFAAIWQASDKIVYSTTLAAVSAPRTQIEREFDPESVRAMKSSAERDLSVGGPHLAAQAFKAGLVDECQLFLVPVAVGSGTRALPNDIRLDLELLDERRFGNGTVYLRYSVRG
jgi:dihydrofolate reductase